MKTVDVMCIWRSARHNDETISLFPFLLALIFIPGSLLIQFSYSQWSFIGNPGLCGYWLSSPCHVSHSAERGEYQKQNITYSFYMMVKANLAVNSLAMSHLEITATYSCFEFFHLFNSRKVIWKLVILFFTLSLPICCPRCSHNF